MVRPAPLLQTKPFLGNTSPPQKKTPLLNDWHSFVSALASVCCCFDVVIGRTGSEGSEAAKCIGLLVKVYKHSPPPSVFVADYFPCCWYLAWLSLLLKITMSVVVVVVVVVAHLFYQRFISLYPY